MQQCLKEQDILMIFGQFFKSEQKILKNAKENKNINKIQMK